MSASAEIHPGGADHVAPWGGDYWGDHSDDGPGEDVELAIEDLRDLYGDGDYCGDGPIGDDDWPDPGLHPLAGQEQVPDPGSAVAGLASAVFGIAPDASVLSDAELAASLATWRQLGSAATARELAATAELARRRPARRWDHSGDDAEPVRVSREAVQEIALALTLTEYGAQLQAELATMLEYRLPATMAAMTTGELDRPRVGIIAEGTGLLDDAAAAQVDAMIAGRAARMTTGELRKAVRNLALSADPDEAEKRREQAERRARVALYGNPDHTATLAGESLPADRAAAAFARVSAIAQAMKSAGMLGGIGRLRAEAFTGLLLGTLGDIPPADGPPPHADPPPGKPPSGGQSPLGGEPASGDEPSRGGEPTAGEPAPGGEPAGSGPAPHGHPAGNEPAPHGEPAGDEAPHGPPTPGDHSLSGASLPGRGPGLRGWPGTSPASGNPASGNEWPATPGSATAAAPGCALIPSWLRLPVGRLTLTVPWRTLAGTGPEPGQVCWLGPVTRQQAAQLAAAAAAGNGTRWNLIVTDDQGHAVALARLRVQRTGHDPPPATRGAPGLVSEVTITIPASIAERLSAGGPSGHGDLPPGGASAGAGEAGPGSPSGSHGAPQCCPVSATRRWATGIPYDKGDILPLAQRGLDKFGVSGLPGAAALAALLTLAIPAAITALAEARQMAARDAAAGGCAHAREASGYRVPDSMRRWLNARDRTCRNPICGRPAWRCDQDHTLAYHKGGRSCPCNLGPECRTHHGLKQLLGWQLTQDQPGYFTWRTPSGLTYQAEPHRYPV